MSSKAPVQFTTVTLLALTTFVAMLMALLPVAFQVSYEIVCLSALALVAVAMVTDISDRLSNVWFRRLLSALLAIALAGITAHITRTFNGSISAFPFMALVITISLALFRVPVFEVGGRTIPLSALAVGGLVGFGLWQAYQTSSQRYFVDRFISSWSAKDIEQAGCVSYGLRSIGRTYSERSSTELDTLFEWLDQDSLLRPITKLRFMVGSDALNSLSFQYAVPAREWHHLSRIPDLRFLDFSGLEISSENAKAFETLRELHQLAFMHCKLPSGVLNRFKAGDKLAIVQITECDVADLVGLSALEMISILNLRQTKLSSEDLVEVSKLPRLAHLSLQNTGIGPTELIAFADALKSNSAQRRGRFQCAVDAATSTMEGLTALIQSGTVNELVLTDCTLNDGELATLRAIDKNVAISRSIKQ